MHRVYIETIQFLNICPEEKTAGRQMLLYIHLGERPVVATEGKYTKHHLTFLFGWRLNHKVLFLSTGLQFSLPETVSSNPSALSGTPMECTSLYVVVGGGFWLGAVLLRMTQLNFTEDTCCNVC